VLAGIALGALALGGLSTLAGRDGLAEGGD